MNTGVCTPWAVTSDMTLPDNQDTTSELLTEALQVASDILFELSGRQWPGACEETIRPLAQWKKVDGPALWWPSSQQQYPWGYCTCHRPRETGCARIPELRLPGYPVDPAHISVKLNGVAFNDFVLHDSRYLVRTDGEGWPCCQDLLLDDDQDRTYSVTYRLDGAPPLGGKRSAAILAWQLVLSTDAKAVQDGRCILPKRVTTITRNQTTLAVVDPLTLFKDGNTGIPYVDQWLNSKRWGQGKRRATVMTPGRPRSARRIG